MKHVVGVDEVGRGPLAGPVGVGVVMVREDFDWALIPDVTDSKKLTEAKREEIFKVAWQLRKTGELNWSVSMVSAKQIDAKGIQWAIRQAMQRGLKRVTEAGPMAAAIGPASVRVLLDGGLKAPEQFVHQETIIKGDAKESTIGLASIVAKVTRDRYMERLASQNEYQVYDFATHKGYGTKAHRAAVLQYGLSPEHRASYCKNIWSW
jgi:ribonuclease HII